MKIKNILLWRELPYLDESIRGYMIRLSQANYTTPQKLYKLALIKGSESNNLLMANNEVDISTLSQLTDAKNEVLLRSTFYYEFGQYISVDEKILRLIRAFGMCSIGYSQICPKCLIESPHHRKHWEIRVSTTCHIHHCNLIKICPKCKYLITSQRHFVTHCDCMFDLRRCGVQRVEETETYLARWLYEKLYCSQITSPFRSEKINELSLRHVLYLHLILSYYITHILSSNVRINYSEASRSVYSQEAAIKAFQMLLNWPRAFHNFIDSYRMIPNLTSFIREPSNQLGSFPVSFLRNFNFPVYSFVVNEFLNYCEDKSTDVPFLKDVKMKFEKRLSRIGKYIDFTALDKEYIKFPTALSILGISEYIMTHLIELEVITMVRDINGWRYCTLESIKKIQGVFEKEIPLIANTKETITFRGIQELLGKKIRVSEFIVAILEQRIQPCGTLKEEIGLNRLIFRVKDVIPLF